MVEIQLFTLHHILVSVQTNQVFRGYNKTKFRVLGAMAMMGVVRKVAKVVCSAIGELPRVAIGDHVLQRVVQVWEASLFEPGFHRLNKIQVLCKFGKSFSLGGMYTIVFNSFFLQFGFCGYARTVGFALYPMLFRSSFSCVCFSSFGVD